SREEFGHYETDTVVSPKRHDSTVSLSVLHERKARFTRLRKVPNLKPSVHAKTLQQTCRDLVRKTITYDNGIENREHETVAEALNIRTFFCNPYHSWEKGSVENTIGRIRRFIPKKANLNDYSDEDVASIEHWLNHTPRKCLQYKTPYEIMIENNLLLSVFSNS
ncbi:IS30 family transposase, partial [Candidatus Peregrinibacteria bacterium CG22_combo_CG10-13_8_21_14_all_49_11]